MVWMKLSWHTLGSLAPTEHRDMLLSMSMTMSHCISHRGGVVEQEVYIMDVHLTHVQQLCDTSLPCGLRSLREAEEART